MPRGEFDRSARRARTRSQLLEAAALAYVDRGVDAATLDDVAERAGYTKGALYDHFGSKDNLLFALLDEHLSARIAEQLELFDANRDVPDHPRIGADRWMAHLEEDPTALRLFVEAWVRGQRDEQVRERVNAGLEPMRAMFRELGRRRAAARGECPDDHALDAAATIFTALGVGFALLKLTYPDGVPSSLLGAAYLLLAGVLDGSPEARGLLGGQPDGA
jgi:AcrR family transcriptional regulator